ncbi:MAG: type II secretion system protein [Minisyncoccia bacterium]
MINKKILQQNKGFTLIEVLIAIFILITAVVVPLTIGSKAFAYSNFVRDQSAASYLAQEAIEFVRLARDNTSLGGGGWTDFKLLVGTCLANPDDTNYEGCYFNAQEVSPSFAKCDLECPSLYQQADGTYIYDVSSNKAFVRSVEILIEGEGTPLERARVDVTVFWTTNGITERIFEVTDYLTPWQK